jgi:hypothetical protein
MLQIRTDGPNVRRPITQTSKIGLNRSRAVKPAQSRHAIAYSREQDRKSRRIVRIRAFQLGWRNKPDHQRPRGLRGGQIDRKIAFRDDVLEFETGVRNCGEAARNLFRGVPFRVETMDVDMKRFAPRERPPLQMRNS